LLSDGNPHTVGLSIFNDFGYFSSTASLLLFLDPGSTKITGALTKNTLTAPNPVVTENLQGTTTVTGTIGVTSDRKFTIAGYVNTSHGKVKTSIEQHQNFSSTITIDFDTVNFTVLNQNTALQNSVNSTTSVSGEEGTVTARDNFSFPITVNVIFPVSSATFGFTVATTQKYHTDKQISFDGFPFYFNSLTNYVNSSDVSPASSSQRYTYFDSLGAFYDCRIASKNNILTSVGRGCTGDKH